MHVLFLIAFFSFEIKFHIRAENRGLTKVCDLPAKGCSSHLCQ